MHLRPDPPMELSRTGSTSSDRGRDDELAVVRRLVDVGAGFAGPRLA